MSWVIIFTGMRTVFAYYGVSCANGNLVLPNQFLSTHWVSTLCNGKTSCSGTVHTSILLDPYYGCQKDFIAVAECPDGRIIADLVQKEAQNRNFFLSCLH